MCYTRDILAAKVHEELSLYTGLHNYLARFAHTQDLMLDSHCGSGFPLDGVYIVVLESFTYVGLVISLLCLIAFIITHLASR